MASEESINEKIAEIQARIDIPSYQDVAWDGAWKRRAAAIWGMMSVALVVGASIGLLALLPPAMFGLPLTAELVGQSVAIFSALGISSGLVIGATVGPGAGAAASAMKEFERRQIARDIDRLVRANPDAPVELIEEMVAQKEEDKEKNLRFSDYVSIKKSLIFAGIGAVGGLVFAGALYAVGGFGVPESPMVAQFAMPAAKFLLGASASSVAVVSSYFAGIGGLFGANFGISYPIITRKAVNFFADLLSGKSIADSWPARVNTPAPDPVIMPVHKQQEALPELPDIAAVSTDNVADLKNYTQKIRPQNNYEELVRQSIAQAEESPARA